MLAGQRRRELDVLELVGDVVVGLGGALERRADRRLDGVADHERGRHQRQADHQRRRGRGGAARVTGGVLLRQPAGDAGERIGHPNTPVTPRTASGLSIVTPTKIAIAPSARPATVDGGRADTGQTGSAGGQADAEQPDAGDDAAYGTLARRLRRHL